MTSTFRLWILASLALASQLSQLAYSQLRDKGHVFIAYGQVERIIKQPKGPFAAMIFYNDALGTQCGLIYYDPMLPGEGEWDLNKRFWQDPAWGSDINDLAWSPDGKYLYIATSGVYSDGYLFRIDLLARKSDRIFPSGDEPFYDLLERDSFSTFIERLDLTKGILRFRVETLNTDKPFKKSIEIKIQ